LDWLCAWDGHSLRSIFTAFSLSSLFARYPACHLAAFTPSSPSLRHSCSPDPPYRRLRSRFPWRIVVSSFVVASRPFQFVRSVVRYFCLHVRFLSQYSARRFSFDFFASCCLISLFRRRFFVFINVVIPAPASHLLHLLQRPVFLRCVRHLRLSRLLCSHSRCRFRRFGLSSHTWLPPSMPPPLHVVLTHILPPSLALSLPLASSTVVSFPCGCSVCLFRQIRCASYSALCTRLFDLLGWLFISRWIFITRLSCLFFSCTFKDG
jgi:hypothetical protein